MHFVRNSILKLIFESIEFDGIKKQQHLKKIEFDSSKIKSNGKK